MRSMWEMRHFPMENCCMYSYCAVNLFACFAYWYQFILKIHYESKLNRVEVLWTEGKGGWTCEKAYGIRLKVKNVLENGKLLHYLQFLLNVCVCVFAGACADCRSRVLHSLSRFSAICWFNIILCSYRSNLWNRFNSRLFYTHVEHSSFSQCLLLEAYHCVWNII